MRFTLRDLLWLTVVAGLCAAWWSSDRSWRKREQSLIRRGALVETEYNDLLHEWDAAGAAMEQAGIEWPPRD